MVPSLQPRHWFLLAVLLNAFLVETHGELMDYMGYEDIESYTTHPCARPCLDGDIAMVCEYDFLIERYHTLTRACHRCPFIQDHCHHPHCVAADGSLRGIITVNRRLPGPPINVCENDIIRVRVHNKMEMGEGVTLHWHGVLQHGTPYMDGVAMVTQCDTPASTSFTYTYRAANPGTHFWHAHTGTQRADGVFGQLVIRQTASKEAHTDLYDIDSPLHGLMVNDWWGTDVATSFAHHHHGTGTNKPSNLLINGKGTYRIFYDTQTRSNVTTPREVFHVQHGMRYRFRIVSNAFLNCPIRMSIDNHMMTVIASDGSPVEPMEVESFTIFAGERYDIVIKADQNVSNYLVRARGLADCGETKNNAFQTAILRYDGAPEDDEVNSPFPVLSGLELNPLNTKQSATKIQVTELRSLSPDDPAVTRLKPDKKFTVAMDFYIINNPRFHNKDLYSIDQSYADGNGRVYTPQMNHITNTLPHSPPLTQLEDIPKDKFCNAETVKDKNCKIDTCHCTHLLKVDLGDVVEVILVDEGHPWNANHPIHLHGHGFRVVAMDRLGLSTYGSIVEEMDRSGNITRNFDKPPIKDTVTVPDGGYTVIRFYADNPGFWFFHCHITYHAEIGMGLIFQVGEKKDLPPMPPKFPKCGSWDGWDYRDMRTTTRPGGDGDGDWNSGNRLSLTGMWMSVVLFLSNTVNQLL